MCMLDIQCPLFQSQGQNSSTKHDGSADFLHGCQIPAVKMTGLQNKDHFRPMHLIYSHTYTVYNKFRFILFLK